MLLISQKEFYLCRKLTTPTMQPLTSDPKSQTVSFSGYRNEKIQISSDDPHILHNLSLTIADTLLSLYDQGMRQFITGGAVGFDTIAAEQIIQLRNTHPEVRLIIATPFPNQESKYHPADQKRYHNTIASADEVHHVSQTYHAKAYLDRNKYMLLRSSRLVCYYDGQRGGTMYTVNRAIEMGHEIINLCYGYTIKKSDIQMSLF